MTTKLSQFLVLALCAAFVGRAPAQAPTWFDLAPAAGIVEAAAPGHALARGAAVADFNGDGLVDFLVPGEVATNYRAFLNLGGWFFVDVSPTASLGPADEAKMCAPCDYDKDGDLDLFVCVRGGPCRLLQNNGMMIFTDVAAAAGLDFVDQSFHATWGDFDRDGDADLYVGVRPIPGAIAANRLFRNNGDGTFADVTAAAGVAHNSLTFACMWFDYDTDGWPDLLVTSDREFSAGRPGNALYRNNHDGTFTNVGPTVGFDQEMQAMGIDVADVGNNGRPCVFISNTATSMGYLNGFTTVDGHVMLLWNPLTNAFDRVETVFGTRIDNVGWANVFFDYDNDGRQDLFVQHMGSPCALFRNTATLPWPNLGVASGFVDAVPECAAGYADFDNDGCFEIVQPRTQAPVCLMRNPGGWGRSWIKIKLVGTVSNRDGFGARVRASTLDGVIRTSWMRSGNGFLVGNEPILHFGLGTNPTVSAIEITWPNGNVQTLTNVAANQTLVVVEPALMSGPPEASGSRTWQVNAPQDPLRLFLTGLSASPGPGIPVGDKVVPLAFDGLFAASIEPGNPFVLGGFGFLDPSGYAAGSFWAPPLPELSGLKIYAATLTMDVVPTFYPRSVLGPLTITL